MTEGRGKPDKISIDHIVNGEGSAGDSPDDIIEIVGDDSGETAGTAQVSEAAEDPGVAAVEDLLNDALKEKEDLRNLYLRTCADLENFRKRVQRDSEEQRMRAAISVVRELLPPLDNLRLALDQAAEQPALRDGLALILKQMEDALAKVGLEPIEALGEPFDPALHEAMTAECREGFEPNTVIEEIRKGYTLGGRVVRPSLVKVVIAGSAEPPEAQADAETSDGQGGTGESDGQDHRD